MRHAPTARLVMYRYSCAALYYSMLYVTRVNVSLAQRTWTCELGARVAVRTVAVRSA